MQSSPRSDLPTVILHWSLVVTLLVSISTGWRISTLTDSSSILQWVDVLVLQGNVLHWHFYSASALTFLIIVYVAFLWRMGLGGRLTFRWVALKSPDSTTRWSAINKLVYWISFILLTGSAATGTLMYFFPGTVPTEPLMAVHEWLSWGFVVYIGLHIVAQLALGGINQLLKILKPRLVYGAGALVALVVGAGAAAVIYVFDQNAGQTLPIARTTSLPVLDGDPTDSVWADVTEVVVSTSRGFNLGGTGEVDVHVKALHDGQKAYFLFRWPDATRSQKHLPLQKTEQGWKLIQSRLAVADENDYYEDKFAVMLARSPVAGGNTVHLGPKPFAERPGAANRLGLHASMEGPVADVWHWKGVRSAATNQFDDNYFGRLMDDPGKGRYTGGYTQDPKTGGGFEVNFSPIEGTPYVAVKYLPRDLSVVQAKMGNFDPDTNVSDPGQYAMVMGDVLPYSSVSVAI